MAYELSNLYQRGLNDTRHSGRPIRSWGDLVFLYRENKLSEEQAETVRKRMAKTIKAARKGFTDKDRAIRYGREIEDRRNKAQRLLAENARKIAELEAQLASLAA